MLMFFAYAGLVFLAMLVEAAYGHGHGQADRRTRNAFSGLVAFMTASLVAVLVAAALPERHAVLDISDWSGLGGTVLAAIALIMGYDLLYYVWHRLQHSVPLLWSVHRKHHSDDTFDCTTYLRQNVLESSLQIVLLGVPFSFLVKAAPEALVMAGLTRATLDFWCHLGAPISMGRMTVVVAGPQLHRHHHARDPRLGDGNFAAFVPLWDVLFGTYVKPEKGCFPETGLWKAEDGSPNGIRTRASAVKGQRSDR